MTEQVRRLARRRAATDVVATLLGIAALGAFVLSLQRAMLYVGAYGLLVGTSTAVVTLCLTQFTGLYVDDGASTDDTTGGGQTDAAGDASEDRDDGDAPSLATRAWATFTGAALETEGDVEEDTGWLIGRMENVVVLTLVLAGQYTALSIVFAAKSWVRVEDTASENTTYYLAGTLVNFTYSIVAGVATRWVVGLV